MAKQEIVDPALLRPNPWNVNIVSPDNEAKLERSLKELGVFKPVVVREKFEKASGTKYEILGGEHRWLAAKNLGLTEIPIFNLGSIDDLLAKKITLADNARYGADDTTQLANFLKEIGSPEELQDFLPYTEADVNAILATSDIALDELDVSEEFERSAEEEPAAAKAPKTHTIMRFKVGLTDAERITALITKTQKKQGFDSSDELMRAGDALVHLLSGESGA